jgi:hypothetical protein
VNNLLCPKCWAEAPADKRSRHGRALANFNANNPAAVALLAWATPDNPPKVPQRPPQKKPVPFRCRRCKAHVEKPSRSALAQLLREILPLPQGTPKKVRERAEYVARRLDGLCDTCAAEPPSPSETPK